MKRAVESRRRPQRAGRAIVLASLVWVALAGPLRADDVPRARILAINDVYRIAGTDGGTAGGLARLRALRAALERDAPVLLLHAGDLLHPSLLSDLYHGAQMIDVLNRLDGDPAAFDPRMLVVFGNHEFDADGCDDAGELRRRLIDSQFRWLAGNIRFGACFDPEGEIPAGRVVGRGIVRVGGIAIGVFGLTTDQQDAAYIDAFEDAVAAGRDATAALRADGADVVTALTHLPVKEDVALLEALGPDGPDLVVGGHDHVRMRWVGGLPIFKADADARTASVIEVAVRGPRVTLSHWYETLDDAAWPADPAVEAAVGGWLERHEREWCAAHGEAAGCLSEPVGTTERRLVAEEEAIRSRETNLGSWLADRARDAFADCDADVAFLNAGALRLNQDLAPGAIERRHVVELDAFDSKLVLIELDGATLQKVADRAVEEWPGSGHFLQVSGFAFRHDRATGAARDLTLLDGGARPAPAEGTLRAVTSTYLAGGGDDYGDLRSRRRIPCDASGRTLADVVLAALDAGAIAPEREGRICADGDADCLAVAAAPPAAGSAAVAGRLWSLLDEPVERDRWLVAAALLLWSIPVLPMAMFFFSGWEARRREVLALFNPDAIESYFYQFYPGGKLFEISVPRAERAASLESKMDDHYRRHSSRWRFALSGLVLAALLVVAIGWTLWTVEGWLRAGQLAPGALAWTAIAALSGGYLRVALDLMERWRSRSFAPADPLYGALRFGIAVPSAYAVASVFDEDLALALAFLVGFLPMAQLVNALRDLWTSRTSLALEPAEALATEALPPVDKRTARRFADEGITTIEALAYADPVVLAIRTQLDFVYVTQCVNVALLWFYVGGKALKTRALGISGAQEAANLYEGVQRARARGRDDAPELATLRALSEQLGHGGADGPTLNLLVEVGTDPHTTFLTRLWRRPSADLVRAVAEADVIFRGEVVAAPAPGRPRPPGASFDQPVRYRVTEVIHPRTSPPLAAGATLDVVHRISPAGDVRADAPEVAEDERDPVRRFPEHAAFLVLARKDDGTWRGCDHVGALVASAENRRRIGDRLLELREFRRAGFLERLMGGDEART